MNSINNNLKPDLDQVKTYSLYDREVWNLFLKSGEVVEMRILGAFGKHRAWAGFAKGTVSGYFDNHTDFCKCLKVADTAECDGVYFTLHVIDPRLIGRALNRLKAADKTTADNNVIIYRWLPVDLDANRPSGISSSDSELKHAMLMREEVAAWVVSNMGLSSPVKGMSGNGGHLLFPLPDIPANKDSEAFIQKTLQGLHKRFSDDQVSIDTSVFNPSRIWKAYGSTARKGDQVPANQYRESRPHRMAFIDDLGEVF